MVSLSGTKSKKAAVKKEKKSERPAKEKTMRPSIPPPSARIQTRHGGGFVERPGRGYSMREVTDAGLGARTARSWKVPLDLRRRSRLDENVSALKKWVSQRKRPSVESRVEGEVKKIEKTVGKEIRKAEEEIEKVEKEVVEKIEAPVKKRTRKKSDTASENS